MKGLRAVLGVTAAATLAACAGSGTDANRNEPVHVTVNGCSAPALRELARDNSLDPATRARLLHIAATVNPPAKDATYSETDCLVVRGTTTRGKRAAEIRALSMAVAPGINAR